MSQTVTVTLPNNVYQNINQFATMTQRTVSDALIEIVRFALCLRCLCLRKHLY